MADAIARGTAAPRQIAVVNAGASTLKLAMVEVTAGRVGRIERAQLEWRDPGNPDAQVREALAALPSPPDAFGHRVVHGGRRLVDPTRLTDAVERELAALIPLAPLHNGPAVAAIAAVRALHPQVPSVAVFDTAFHAQRPAASYAYALSRDLTERHGLRRYGFHGLAHASLVEGLAAAAGVPTAEVRAVTLQLGAGCSACAVEGGRSIETSMGFTPLEGLVMATRSGDVDPGVVLHLMQAGYTADQIEAELTHRGGWFGLCGEADMRSVVVSAAAGSAEAELALEVFCRRLVLMVGGYLTLLGGVGALVFGGGIGTHSAPLRARICSGLAAWGVMIDPERNQRPDGGLISRDGSRPVYALRTDEESVVARAVYDHLA